MGAPQSQAHSSIFRNDLKVMAFLRGLLPVGATVKNSSSLPIIPFFTLFSDDGRRRHELALFCFLNNCWLEIFIGI